MEVHPSSFLSDGVELDKDVKIGPFCIIEGKVRIGKGTRLHGHVTIGNPHSEVIIGENNDFYSGVAVGGPPQDKTYLGEATKLVIGDRNQLRECVTISSGTIKGGGVTRIGDDNLIMAYSHFGHDCQVGNNNAIANSSQFGGHVHLGNGVFVGGMCAINQFVSIGDYCFLGGYSAVNKDILPYTIAQGNYAVMRATNKIGLERAGFKSDKIENIHKAIRILIKGSSTIKEALQRIKEECVQDDYIANLVHFVSSSERGIAK